MDVHEWHANTEFKSKGKTKKINSKRKNKDNEKNVINKWHYNRLSLVHYLREGMLKWPLRALGEGIVPDKIRFNKIKRGFNASIMSLIDLDNPNTKERLLSESPIFDLIKRDSIESFINTNNFSDNENSKFLFNFISTKLFLEQPLFSNREPH